VPQAVAGGCYRDSPGGTFDETGKVLAYYPFSKVARTWVFEQLWVLPRFTVGRYNAAMGYAALAEFLEELSGCGQLTHITAEVDPELEIAEITRRVAARGGPALLFERIRGQSMSVATNVLGSEARVCRALDIESLDGIIPRIESLVREHTPQNWFERLKTNDDASGVNKFRPKSVKVGPCQQVVRLGRDVDLGGLPLVKQWPGESGPMLSGGLLVSQAPGADHRSVTACPLVALDHQRLAVVNVQGGAATHHWAAYRQAGQRMAVAAVLGGDPAGSIAAHLELPPSIDADHLRGLLRGRAVDVVKCRTHGLEVPAEAELVVEGYLDPETPEAGVCVGGALGMHHPLEQSAPVLHVTAITHRTHPILLASIDTGEHGEAAALLKVRERVLLPALRTLAPGIVDLHLPALGGLYNYAFVSIHKSYPFHARQIASALWGSQSLRFIKFLVLVDAEVPVRDVRSVLAEIGAKVSPEHDTFSYDGPVAAASAAGALVELGRHLGIDATTKIAGEQAGPTTERLSADAEIEELVELVDRRWSEYGLEAPR
jgi:4-hydroxy-3-polyprenylbenzoate decarboxylase